MKRRYTWFYVQEKNRTTLIEHLLYTDGRHFIHINLSRFVFSSIFILKFRKLRQEVHDLKPLWGILSQKANTQHNPKDQKSWVTLPTVSWKTWIWSSQILFNTQKLHHRGKNWTVLSFPEILSKNHVSSSWKKKIMYLKAIMYLYSLFQLPSHRAILNLTLKLFFYVWMRRSDCTNPTRVILVDLTTAPPKRHLLIPYSFKLRAG